MKNAQLLSNLVALYYNRADSLLNLIDDFDNGLIDRDDIVEIVYDMEVPRQDNENVTRANLYIILGGKFNPVVDKFIEKLGG